MRCYTVEPKSVTIPISPHIKISYDKASGSAYINHEIKAIIIITSVM